MEIKAINGHYKSVTKTEQGEKIYSFIASTSDPDRHGHIVNQSAWELGNFMQNPIIGYQHNVWGNMCGGDDPDDVVGKAIKAYIEDDKLMVDVLFDSENEKAMKIASKIDRGFLSTVSVGFKEIGKGHYGDEEKDEVKELYYFEGQELMELSIVNLPANPNAKRKSFRSQTFDAIKFIYKELGGNYKLSEIEDMKVGNVINLLDYRTIKGLEKDEDKVKSIETKETEAPEGNTLSTTSEAEETRMETDNSLEREREQETLTLIEKNKE